MCPPPPPTPPSTGLVREGFLEEAVPGLQEVAVVREGIPGQTGISKA